MLLTQADRDRGLELRVACLESAVVQIVQDVIFFVWQESLLTSGLNRNCRE